MKTIAEFAYETYLNQTGEQSDITYEEMLATVSPEMIERGDLLADFVLLELSEVVGKRRVNDVEGLQEAINAIQRARDQLWTVEQALFVRREDLLLQRA